MGFAAVFIPGFRDRAEGRWVWEWTERRSAFALGESRVLEIPHEFPGTFPAVAPRLEVIMKMGVRNNGIQQRVPFAVLLAGVVGFALWAPAAFGASTRITVTRFDQETGHLRLSDCRTWDYSQQDQLRTVLEGELSDQGLKVLERRSIRVLYEDEHQMENLNDSTKPRKKRFLSAQYAVVGSIVELGICEEGSDSGVQLGGVIGLLGGPGGADLEVGKKRWVSKVKLRAQLVSTETGEVVKSFTARAEIVENGSSWSAGVYGIGARNRSSSAPPIERATNDALKDLAGQIAQYVQKAG